jgi:Icc-related predicted phosphoesterase
MFWKKNKKAGEKLTIFFASDLHGSSVCFKKFINGAQFYGASVLIMGGDTTGKAVIPITEQNDGSFLGFQSGADIRLNGRDEVDEFIKRVNNQGFYPIVMTEDEFQALKDDAEAQAQLFKKLVCDRVREWCDFAGDKLKGTARSTRSSTARPTSATTKWK